LAVANAPLAGKIEYRDADAQASADRSGRLSHRLSQLRFIELGEPVEILRNRSPSRKRIGELLVEAGIIKPDKVPEGLKVVKQTGLPLGRVLIMLGVLKEQDLENTLFVQALLRDGALPGDGALAIRALKVAYRDQVTVDGVLTQMGWQKPAESLPVTELAELLIACGAVGGQQVQDAIRKGAQNHLPIGRCLVLNAGLPPTVLAAALSAQVLIKAGKVTREQAVHGLKLALLKRTSVEQALVLQGVLEEPRKETIKLGELFGAAAVVSEHDSLIAVEMGLSRDQPMGQILVQAGFVSADVLDAALKLQELVASGVVNGMQASELLKQVNAKHITVQQALSESGLLSRQDDGMKEVFNLLKTSGFLSEAQSSQIQSGSSAGALGLRGALIASRLVDEALVNAASRCCRLIAEGLLKLEQAIIALNYCQRSRISLEDAFEELTWDIPLGTTAV